jgi:integrase
LTFVGEGDKAARVPVPLPALPAVQAATDGRTSGPLLRTRSGAGMDRRSVHRYVARTAQVAGISRPIGPHALRRTVGTVGLNQGIPLRDIQRLLRHARPESTLASYDISAMPSSGMPPIKSPASSPAGRANRARDEGGSRFGAASQKLMFPSARRSALRAA